MKKLKNLMQKISEDVKKLIKNFPLTIFIILVVTLVCMFCIDQDFSRETRYALEKFYIFSGIWVLGTFFTETFFLKKLNKNISYGVTGVISYGFVKLLETSVVEELTLKLLITYILILSAITIYKSIKNANLSFKEYTLKVFKDFLNSSIVYVILNIGVIILTVIFVELILDGEYGNILPRMIVLLLGGFYAPSIVYTISNVNKNEVTGFVKGLVVNVLLPLVIIAVGIIYLYIAKIIILRDMPKNVIFRILAGIFVVAFPVWNMAKNYSSEKKTVGKIVRVLPYLYVPFILLEIYSIGVRIADYGITEARYFSCIFIILQVIILFLEFYKNGEKISQIYIIFAIIGVIAFLSPLSFDNLSNRSQKKIFEEIFPAGTNFESLTNEEKERVQDVYRYLKYSVNGENYIPQYLTEEQKNQINNYFESSSGNYHNDFKYCYYEKELELDITDYKRIYQVKEYVSDSCIVEIGEFNQSVDLRDLVEKIRVKEDISSEEGEQYFYQNNLVKINEKQDLYISEISLEYHEDAQNVEYLRIEGYLLDR